MREEKEGRRGWPILVMTKQLLSWMEETLWPRGEKRDIWMILDAARDRAIFRMLLECGLEYSCLYSGTLPPALEIAAPYLVQLEYQDRYTRRFLEQAWGNSWGIILKCDQRLDRLRRHLRQFLVVRDPRGGRLVFRYYDPRVLRVYLPTCNTEDLGKVFGPIQCFWTEGQASGSMLEFNLEGGKLVQRKLSTETVSERRTSGQNANPGWIPSARQWHEMLTIRPEQLQVFSRVEVDKFEEWMLAHLQKFFPAQCQTAGQSQLRETIQAGIKRAAAYDMTSKREVCKYIDLMIVFGRDFDKDRRYPWASEILAREASPVQKIRNLHEAAQLHLRQP
jgi:hypothetical protein